jgi:hypothetical protein
MDTAGGNARKLVSREGLYFYHPAWYAGRQRILYLLAHDVAGYSGLADASLESLDLGTNRSLTLRTPCLDFAVVPGGRIVYAEGSSLWTIPTDAQTAEPTGPPR